MALPCPDYLASALYEIPLSFYKEEGVKVLLLDLDNTLASHREKRPDERALSYVRKLKEAGLEVYVVSNNSKKRVGDYASHLGVAYLHLAMKPFAFRFASFLKKKGIEREGALLIGDQLYTDVRSANRLGIRCCLTSPLVEDDPIWTRYNRYRERKGRAALLKRGGIATIKEE